MARRTNFSFEKRQKELAKKKKKQDKMKRRLEKKSQPDDQPGREFAVEDLE